MDDFKLLKDLFDRTKIEYEERKETDGTTSLVVEEGYAGFYTEFTFSKGKELLSVGAYE
jgi:hypothetical protein